MRGLFKGIFSSLKEYVVLVVLLLVSLSLVSLNEKPQIKKVRTFALGGFAVFTSLIQDVTEVFTETDEVKTLRTQNAKLMLQVNLLRQHGLENRELKSLMGFKDTTGYSLIPASVVSRLVSKSQGNIIVNAGLSDSVKIGMPVVNTNGLVGLITDVSESYSVVRTLQNSNMKLAVTDQRSSVHGILEWSGSQHIIKNIPTTYDIKAGDRIISSEFSTIIPPNIPVGVIAEKTTNISGLLSSINVQSFVDFNSTKNVFILDMITSPQIDSLELNLLKKTK
ncbi:MAG: rod shape-determining protein MreC [Melioribacteraceae bacterium]|nr:rod shape-determining protein MreC [Melioribacteraceae bacterium]